LEWEPNERDAWVADAQRWICQIKGVLQCKIDLDSGGEVVGVHVVAGMDREPRHIVRDVESLLKARLGIDVYYKKIGVVQVMDNGVALPPAPEAPAATPESAPVTPPVPANGVTFHPPGDTAFADQDLPANASPSAIGDEIPPPPLAPAAPPPEESEPIPAVLVAEEMTPRIVCAGVGVMASDLLVRAEVQLQAGELEARGTLEGSNHADSDVALIARATLDAIAGLMAEEVVLHLREVKVEDLGGQSVILTAVDVVEGRRTETLFGTCSTRHNRQQGVVYSVLDALNRRLSLYTLKSAAAEG